jgi:hypothetical protein
MAFLITGLERAVVVVACRDAAPRATSERRDQRRL